MTVFEKIKQALEDHGAKYTTHHHEPVVTSAQASEVRGTDMHQGAKALVIRGNKTKEHIPCVMPADPRLDSKKLRAIIGERTSFAKDPVDVTGCVRGSVPPFGSIIGLKTYMDGRLSENEEITFNAGSLTDSIEMKYKDYIVIEKPEVVDITE